jgi:small subunit ribosomal protein S17
MKDAIQTAQEHGFRVRGNIFTGIVVSAKAQKTCSVKRELTTYVKKYERYWKRTVRMQAHVPDYLKVVEGDNVRIGETRRISKTKSFMVLEVLGHMKTVGKTDEVTSARRRMKKDSEPIAEEKE